MDPDIQGLWFGCMNNESVTWKALLWRQIDDQEQSAMFFLVAKFTLVLELFQQATFTTIAHNSFNLLIFHSLGFLSDFFFDKTWSFDS